MDLHPCESCSRQIPAGSILCLECAGAEGRCAQCGTSGVYRGDGCPRCSPAAGFVAVAPQVPGDAGAGLGQESPSGLARTTAKPPGPVTRLLFGACLVISGGIAFSGGAAETLQRWGYTGGAEVINGAYWGLITHTFIHFELLHLVFNLYWLWVLGGAFERSVGSVRWVAFFLGAAAVSSAVQLATGSFGIGMSGVGYALFGFGWAARSRYADLAEVVDDSTVRLFLGWGAFCIVADLLGLLPIANGAHGGGLLFGLAVAHAFAFRERRVLGYAGIAALVGISLLPFTWCPWSEDWQRVQVHRALGRRDYARAIEGYRDSLRVGGNAALAWRGLAEIYGYQKRHTEYQEALRQLRALDASAADEVERNYGTPAPLPAAAR